MEGTDLFIVDLKVSTANKIKVTIDGMSGVGIDDCVSVSRNIEHNLDREEEDFELEVTTAGLDQPFTVPQQYEKNIGKEVKLKLADGKKLTGTLLAHNDNSIEIETKRKERLEGKKKKVEIVENVTIDKDQIQETKIIISFK